MLHQDTSKNNTLSVLMVSVLLALLFLNAIIWLTPIAFSASKATDVFCHFWYYLSQSGGSHFSPYIVIALCLLFASRGGSRKKRFVGCAASLVLMGVLLSAVASFNEFVTKPLLSAQRPSILFLARHGVVDLQHYYFDLQTKQERRAYMAQALTQPAAQNAILQNEKIDPLVLNHWAEESGYSFPSGHSLNAFLLGTLAALFFLFYFDARGRLLFIAPLVWAVLVGASRTAIGVHNPVDIFAGSLVGAVLGLGCAALLLKSKALYHHRTP
jgi:phosphatidylglycerophosphatase B